jgi:hypothetical protein
VEMRAKYTAHESVNYNATRRCFTWKLWFPSPPVSNARILSLQMELPDRQTDDSPDFLVRCHHRNTVVTRPNVLDLRYCLITSPQRIPNTTHELTKKVQCQTEAYSQSGVEDEQSDILASRETRPPHTKAPTGSPHKRPRRGGSAKPKKSASETAQNYLRHLSFMKMPTIIFVLESNNYYMIRGVSIQGNFHSPGSLSRSARSTSSIFSYVGL